jgi:hypothetical protein
MHWFHKFILSWNSTCFGQFVCPSSGVYSLYTQQWYVSYRFVDSSKAVYKPVWHVPLLSVQWINSWWWKDELSETCRVSWQNKFVKLVHPVGFITKKNKTVCSFLSVFFMAVFDKHYNIIRSIFRVLIRSKKYVNDQKIHFNIYDVLYS